MIPRSRFALSSGRGFTSCLHLAWAKPSVCQGSTSRQHLPKLAGAGCTAPRLSPAKGFALGSSFMPLRSAPSARELKRCSPTNGSLTNEGGGGQGGRAQRNKGGGPAQPVRRTFAEPFPPGLHRPLWPEETRCLHRPVQPEEKTPPLLTKKKKTEKACT